MNITYDYYRVFYVVAQYGSFSKAASVLMNGQPNVTKVINNLEKQLNCKLFVRSNRGVNLTPEGEKLFDHVSVAFEHLQMAEQEIVSAQALDSGFLSIATTEIALYGSVLSALQRFRSDYPNVKIRLTNQSSPQALDALKNGLAELCVLTLPNKPNDEFRFKPIREFRELLCSKRGLLGNDPVADSSIVLSEPFISLGRSTSTYEFYRSYFLNCDIQKEPDIEVATAEQILPLIKAGIGIGFVSEFLAKQGIENGEIEEIRLKNPPPSRTIYLAEDKKRSLSIVARTFAKYLLEL